MWLHAKFIVDFIFTVVLFTQHIFRFLFVHFYGHKFASSQRDGIAWVRFGFGQVWFGGRWAVGTWELEGSHHSWQAPGALLCQP